MLNLFTIIQLINKVYGSECRCSSCRPPGGLWPSWRPNGYPISWTSSWRGLVRLVWLSKQWTWRRSGQRPVIRSNVSSGFLLRKSGWVHLYFPHGKKRTVKPHVYFFKHLLFRGKTLEEFSLWVKEKATTAPDWNFKKNFTFCMNTWLKVGFIFALW